MGKHLKCCSILQKLYATTIILVWSDSSVTFPAFSWSGKLPSGIVPYSCLFWLYFWPYSLHYSLLQLFRYIYARRMYLSILREIQINRCTGLDRIFTIFFENKILFSRIKSYLIFTVGWCYSIFGTVPISIRICVSSFSFFLSPCRATCRANDH